ncbi:MAG: FixG Ig-like domain-containing protein [Cetobacterium sp.]|uniref:COG1470 family protein n=1 Tax=Cetobacterium sp. TaxID=2071632 RepID=UPI003F2C3D20
MLKKTFMLFFFLCSITFSYINIFPVNFNKRIDLNDGVVEYSLYNKTEKTVRYRISLVDSDKNSMAKWGEIYPTTLSLKPGEEKTIKLYIKAPKNAKKGEYSAFLNIKEMEFPNLEKNASRKNTVNILTNLTMEILGYVGDVEPKLDIRNLKVAKDKTKLSFDGNIKNIGERSGDYNIFLSDSRGNNQYFLGDFNILKDEMINLSEFNQEIKDKKISGSISKLNWIFIVEKNGSKVVQRLPI